MKADRPQFLKIPYNGSAALDELAAFDPTLVVGVLDGSAGTTRDTFELIYQAGRHGGRLALFGRKINLAESPLALIKLMREVADGTIEPAQAVRAYHGALESEASGRPVRSTTMCKSPKRRCCSTVRRISFTAEAAAQPAARKLSAISAALSTPNCGIPR